MDPEISLKLPVDNLKQIQYKNKQTNNDCNELNQ